MTELSQTQLVGKIPELRRVPEATAMRAMPEIVRRVAERGQELAPKRTGRLAKSITGKMERAAERGVVRASARHAHLVHNDVRPHTTTGRALRVAAGPDGVIYRRSSRHPGTKGRPFLTQALEQTRDEVSSILADAASGALDEVSR